MKAEAQVLRDQLAPAAGVDERETYRPIVIPELRRQVTDRSEQRVRWFLEILNDLIKKAGAQDAGEKAHETASDSSDQPDTARNPGVLAVLRTACGFCQGYCCQRGGEHAYLSVDTIRRYTSSNPGLSPGDVRDAYLAHVGQQSIEGSCIFHGPAGCRLPRDMRSDTCNRYYCGGLKDLQNGVSSEGRIRVFFAAAQGVTIVDAAFYGENGLRTVPVPPPDDREAGAGDDSSGTTLPSSPVDHSM